MNAIPDLKSAPTEAAAIAALVAEQSRPFVLDVAGVPMLLTPQGWSTAGGENNLPVPRRLKGLTMLGTTDALARFCALFPEAPTQVLTSRQRLWIEVIFNPNTAAGPGWHDHGARVSFKLDACLERWKKLAGEWLTQDKFGEFLRERGVDICDPAQGKILDLVENLEAHCNSKGKWKRNGQTGAVTVEWDEEVKATTIVPPKFTLRLTVFAESETMLEVECRLNFRAGPEGLKWQFLMDDFEAAVDSAWDEQVEAFKDHPALPPGVAARVFSAAQS